MIDIGTGPPLVLIPGLQGRWEWMRPAVDAFFDQVMVMDPDQGLRTNRLALLTRLRDLFAGIADLSKLPG